MGDGEGSTEGDTEGVGEGVGVAGEWGSLSEGSFEGEGIDETGVGVVDTAKDVSKKGLGSSEDTSIVVGFFV